MPVAVLLHRSTFAAIQAWAASPSNAKKPFSAVYAHLAVLGYVVRVSATPLAMLRDEQGTDAKAFCGTHDQMMDYFAKNG